MARIKPFFSLNECETKQIVFGDNTYLSVVGSRILKLNYGHFNALLCIPNLPCDLLIIYQINHLGEGKPIEFLPPKAVIKELKNILKNVIVDDITKVYNIDIFRSSPIPSIYIPHSNDMSRLYILNYLSETMHTKS